MPDNDKRQARPIHYAVIGKSKENIDTLASLGAKMNVQDAVRNGYFNFSLFVDRMVTPQCI